MDGLDISLGRAVHVTEANKPKKKTTAKTKAKSATKSSKNTSAKKVKKQQSTTTKPAKQVERAPFQPMPLTKPVTTNADVAPVKIHISSKHGLFTRGSREIEETSLKRGLSRLRDKQGKHMFTPEQVETIYNKHLELNPNYSDKASKNTTVDLTGTLQALAAEKAENTQTKQATQQTQAALTTQQPVKEQTEIEATDDIALSDDFGAPIDEETTDANTPKIESVKINIDSYHGKFTRGKREITETSLKRGLTRLRDKQGNRIFTPKEVEEIYNKHLELNPDYKDKKKTTVDVTPALEALAKEKRELFSPKIQFGALTSSIGLADDSAEINIEEIQMPEIDTENNLVFNFEPETKPITTPDFPSVKEQQERALTAEHQKSLIAAEQEEREMAEWGIARAKAQKEALQKAQSEADRPAAEALALQEAARREAAAAEAERLAVEKAAREKELDTTAPDGFVFIEKQELSQEDLQDEDKVARQLSLVFAENPNTVSYQDKLKLATESGLLAHTTNNNNVISRATAYSDYYVSTQKETQQLLQDIETAKQEDKPHEEILAQVNTVRANYEKMQTAQAYIDNAAPTTQQQRELSNITGKEFALGINLGAQLRSNPNTTDEEILASIKPENRPATYTDADIKSIIARKRFEIENIDPLNNQLNSSISNQEAIRINQEIGALSDRARKEFPLPSEIKENKTRLAFDNFLKSYNRQPSDTATPTFESAAIAEATSTAEQPQQERSLVLKRTLANPSNIKPLGMQITPDINIELAINHDAPKPEEIAEMATDSIAAMTETDAKDTNAIALDTTIQQEDNNQDVLAMGWFFPTKEVPQFTKEGKTTDTSALSIQQSVLEKVRTPEEMATMPADELNGIYKEMLAKLQKGEDVNKYLNLLRSISEHRKDIIPTETRTSTKFDLERGEYAKATQINGLVRYIAENVKSSTINESITTLKGLAADGYPIMLSDDDISADDIVYTRNDETAIWDSKTNKKMDDHFNATRLTTDRNDKINFIRTKKMPKAEHFGAIAGYLIAGRDTNDEWLMREAIYKIHSKGALDTVNAILQRNWGKSNGNNLEYIADTAPESAKREIYRHLAQFDVYYKLKYERLYGNL